MLFYNFLIFYFEVCYKFFRSIYPTYLSETIENGGINWFGFGSACNSIIFRSNVNTFCSVSKVFFDILSKKIKKNNLIILCLILNVIFYLLLSFNKYNYIVALSFLFITIFYSAINLFILKYFITKNKRSEDLNKYFIIKNIGSIIGSLLSGFILNSKNISKIFKYLSISFLFLFIIFIYFKKPNKELNYINKIEKNNNFKINYKDFFLIFFCSLLIWESEFLIKIGYFPLINIFNKHCSVKIFCYKLNLSCISFISNFITLIICFITYYKMNLKFFKFSYKKLLIFNLIFQMLSFLILININTKIYQKKEFSKLNLILYYFLISIISFLTNYITKFLISLNISNESKYLFNLLTSFCFLLFEYPFNFFISKFYEKQSFSFIYCLFFFSIICYFFLKNKKIKY